MTHLLDLPNELLLMVAAEMDMDDRRRFSKICRRSFHLIRDHPNKSRYSTEWDGGEGTDIMLAHVTADACVLWVADVPRGKGDLRVIALLSDNSQKIPVSLWEQLSKITARPEQIHWLRTAGEVLETAMEMLLQGLGYYHDVYSVHFVAPIRAFDRSFATRFFGLRRLTTFHIMNDNDDADDLFVYLITMYMRYVKEQDATNMVHNQDICVREHFRHNWTNAAQELTKLQESSKRILQSLCAEDVNLRTRYSDSMPNCFGRELRYGVIEDNFVASIEFCPPAEYNPQPPPTDMLQQQPISLQQQNAAPVANPGPLQLPNVPLMQLQQQHQHQQQLLLQQQYYQQYQQQRENNQQPGYQHPQHFQQQHQQHYLQPQQHNYPQLHHVQQGQQHLQPVAQHSLQQPAEDEEPISMPQMIVRQLHILQRHDAYIVQQSAAAATAPSLQQLYALRQQMQNLFYQMHLHEQQQQQEDYQQQAYHQQPQHFQQQHQQQQHQQQYYQQQHHNYLQPQQEQQQEQHQQPLVQQPLQQLHHEEQQDSASTSYVAKAIRVCCTGIWKRSRSAVTAASVRAKYWKNKFI